MAILSVKPDVQRSLGQVVRKCLSSSQSVNKLNDKMGPKKKGGKGKGGAKPAKSKSKTGKTKAAAGPSASSVESVTSGESRSPQPR